VTLTMNKIDDSCSVVLQYSLTLSASIFYGPSMAAKW